MEPLLAWAAITRDGELVDERSWIQTSVRTVAGSVGAYEVTFAPPFVDEDLCSWTATLAEPGEASPEDAEPGEIDVSPKPGQRRTLVVRTWDVDGAPAPRAFHVVVSWCWDEDASAPTDPDDR